ncbi:MAG: hypothetical protein LBI08_04235 [Methanomassiliicoccaceae archaeon]|jgi:hypothetical protein|nr:hypothetical protein [Methanomassiliicoccaceae archaeon]
MFKARSGPSEREGSDADGAVAGTHAHIPGSGGCASTPATVAALRMVRMNIEPGT